jgi:hypothetical protein
MTDQPTVAFTINGRPMLFRAAPVAPGTPCGICAAASTGTGDQPVVSIACDGLGPICPDCANAAMPGLDLIANGMTELLHGLIEARAAGRLMEYEAVAQQAARAVRGIADTIAAAQETPEGGLDVPHTVGY